MSDNYCKCKGCRHIDPNERSGYKWYCTWYRSYEDPDYVHECSHFESQERSGCVLTSACCQHKGLPDDCTELTTLRTFRDTYLMNSEVGCQLVDEYYRIAPVIVEKLGRHPNQDAIYESIYETICSIMSLLEQREFAVAIEKYKEMVFDVQAAVSRETNAKESGAI